MVPERVRTVMLDMIARIRELQKEVSKVSQRPLKAVQEESFVTKGGELVKGAVIVNRLRTIPGVGPLLACVWLAQVGDASRYRHPMEVAAFCGFDPSLVVSAGKVTAHTRRKGNKFLHYMIKKGAGGLINKAKEPLGAWGAQIRSRPRSGGFTDPCAKKVDYFLAVSRN